LRGLLAADGAQARGYVVDVRDAAAVAAMMRSVHDELGGPHVLVTLAGGSLGTPRDLPDITPEDVDLVIDFNVKGTLYCAQAAVPFMVEAGGGAIITTSSIGGRQPSPVTGVPYATSKAAVVGLTKRLAREVGPQGIRVNAIAPGLFLTGRLQGMYDAMPESERREVLDAIPLDRSRRSRRTPSDTCASLGARVPCPTDWVKRGRGSASPWRPSTCFVSASRRRLWVWQGMRSVRQWTGSGNARYSEASCLRSS
jgi:NAD(P)-dependent dehydrogenase (short-subunit alcohol dehydrogenase family)